MCMFMCVRARVCVFVYVCVCVCVSMFIYLHIDDDFDDPTDSLVTEFTGLRVPSHYDCRIHNGSGGTLCGYVYSSRVHPTPPHTHT